MSDKKTERKPKQLTAMEQLRLKPRALRVGPQPELRKNWPDCGKTVLKGGLG